MIFRKILTQTGNAILNVVVASTVVGIGAAMLSRSGGLRGDIALDMNQNSVIQNAVLEMKIHLVDPDNCNAAFLTEYEAGNPLTIGDYQSDSDLTLGVFVNEIRAVQLLDDDYRKALGLGPNDALPADLSNVRLKKILLSFRKEGARVGADGQKTSRDRPEFIFIQDFTNSTGERACSSVEVENLGIDDSFQAFCLMVGGTYVQATGACDTSNLTDTDFTDEVFKASCAAMGGELAGDGQCSRVNISGPITSSHFSANSIIFDNGTRRDGHVDFDCQSQGQFHVARGIQANGRLDCVPLTCPAPSGNITSTYQIAAGAGDSFVCKCTKNNPKTNVIYSASSGAGTRIYSQIFPRNNANPPNNMSCSSGSGTDAQICDNQTYWLDDGCQLRNNQTRCEIRGTIPHNNCPCAVNTWLGDTCKDANGCNYDCPGTRALVCGSAAGQPASAEPTTNLCPNGLTVTGMSESTPGIWSWRCTNAGFGVDCATVAENKVACGGADGQQFADTTSLQAAERCPTGATVANFSGTGPWTWNCTEAGKTDSDECSASQMGGCACGDSEGDQFATLAAISINSKLCSLGCNVTDLTETGTGSKLKCAPVPGDTSGFSQCTGTRVQTFGPVAGCLRACEESGNNAIKCCQIDDRGNCDAYNGAPTSQNPTQNWKASVCEPVTSTGPYEWTCTANGKTDSNLCRAEGQDGEVTLPPPDPKVNKQCPDGINNYYDTQEVCENEHNSCLLVGLIEGWKGIDKDRVDCMPKTDPTCNPFYCPDPNACKGEADGVEIENRSCNNGDREGDYKGYENVSEDICCSGCQAIKIECNHSKTGQVTKECRPAGECGSVPDPQCGVARDDVYNALATLSTAPARDKCVNGGYQYANETVDSFNWRCISLDETKQVDCSASKGGECTGKPDGTACSEKPDGVCYSEKCFSKYVCPKPGEGMMKLYKNNDVGQKGTTCRYSTKQICPEFFGIATTLPSALYVECNPMEDGPNCKKWYCPAEDMADQPSPTPGPDFTNYDPTNCEDIASRFPVCYSTSGFQHVRGRTEVTDTCTPNGLTICGRIDCGGPGPTEGCNFSCRIPRNPGDGDIGDDRFCR